AFPPYGFDWSTPPNPTVPYNNNAFVMGHSTLPMILPYVEQQNLVNLSRFDRSVFDPSNLPPPLGVNLVTTSKIKIFQCPSAPVRDANYGPYFAGVLAQLKAL